jgi:hypothetical protein
MTVLSNLKNGDLFEWQNKIYELADFDKKTDSARVIHVGEINADNNIVIINYGVEKNLDSHIEIVKGKIRMIFEAD